MFQSIVGCREWRDWQGQGGDPGDSWPGGFSLKYRSLAGYRERQGAAIRVEQAAVVSPDKRAGPGLPRREPWEAFNCETERDERSSPRREEVGCVCCTFS